MKSSLIQLTLKEMTTSKARFHVANEKTKKDT